MPKSYSRKNKKDGTRKNMHEKKDSHTLKHFQKEITVIFLEMLLMVKLYHWKTHSYATHKATDELYESLNSNIDKFIEVLLGKTGSRIDLMHHNKIHLIDLDSQDKLKSKVERFKSYLVGLDNNKALHSGNMTNSDLFNIRDEIMGDMNKFLYLLTFK